MPAIGIITWIKIGLVIALMLAVWAGYAAIKHAGYAEAEAKYKPKLEVCISNTDTLTTANNQLKEDFKGLDSKYAKSQEELAAAGAQTKEAIRAAADAKLDLKKARAAASAAIAVNRDTISGPPAPTKEKACEDADRISLDYARSMRDKSK